MIEAKDELKTREMRTPVSGRGGRLSRYESDGSRRPCSYLAMLVCLLMAISANADKIIPDKAGRSEASQELRIDEANLANDVNTLQSTGNRRSFRNQWATARWIETRLSGMGMETRIDEYDYRGKKWPNVIATKHGRLYPDRIVMAVAHFDSNSDDPAGPAPGADDNGSGVAALLEIARVIAGQSNKKTIMLVFFSNEEKGAKGSKAFVDKEVVRKLQIEAVLNIDMIGFNNSRQVSLAAVLKTRQTFKQQLKACYGLALNWLNHLFKGNDVIKIAGRGANADLASAVTDHCLQIKGLKVVKMIRDDCG